MPRRHATLAALLLGAALTLLAWWWPNRERGEGTATAGERINSVSFAPFRPGQSPLAGRFPSAAEVEEDARLLAPRVGGLRTYAALEGDYDVAEIAGRHGLRVWKGAWLGRDLSQNERELARLLELARRHPETITRLVVGNEVLLRRDLPPEVLTRHLDRVRAAAAQPVTYADVWEFWVQFPEVARHVDVVTFHVLPYWEDEPRAASVALDHVRDVVRRMRAAFPDKPLAIGEIGWPSRGRWREAAAPSRVEQALFLRGFSRLAREEGVEYNLIEAFDQVWKYRHEGTVGAAWGLWTAEREPKFPLDGPLREDPHWWRHALAALLLSGGLLAASALAHPEASRPRLALLSAALGNALAYAWAGTVPYAFDAHLTLAAAVNLSAQALLAALLLRRAGRLLSGLPVEPPRTGAQATASVRALLRGRLRLRDWRGFLFEDLVFLFAWTAALLQLLLLFDPRYRDFPLATFAVPAVAALARAWLRDLPRGGGGRAEALAGGTLALAALASLAREGAENLQALGWTAVALGLSVPLLLRLLPAGR